MTLPPKDYLATRRAEIFKQIDELKGELGDLDAMESAYKQRHSKGTEYRQTDWVDEPAPGPMMTTQTRQRFEISIKQMVLEVLENTTGYLALDMLAAIKDRFGVEIERTSLSPQLSRLKGDGFIEAYENVWRITREGRNLLVQMRAAQKN